MVLCTIQGNNVAALVALVYSERGECDDGEGKDNPAHDSGNDGGDQVRLCQQVFHLGNLDNLDVFARQIELFGGVEVTII